MTNQEKMYVLGQVRFLLSLKTKTSVIVERVKKMGFSASTAYQYIKAVRLLEAQNGQ